MFHIEIQSFIVADCGGKVLSRVEFYPANVKFILNEINFGITVPGA